MFDSIISNPELFHLIRQNCSENDIGIDFHDEFITSDGMLDSNKVLVLKPDSFYSSKLMHNPPPAVDYLILLKCEELTVYYIYLIELRNTKNTTGIKPNIIRKKFETVINDFLLNQFTTYFPASEIIKIKCYLVTDPLKMRGKGLNETEMRSYMRGTVLDAYSNLEPLVYKNKNLIIEPLLPNPIIEKC